MHHGWKAQIGLEEGLTHTVDWFRSHLSARREPPADVRPSRCLGRTVRLLKSRAEGLHLRSWSPLLETDEPMREQELLIFLHIPKTAGTTLRWFLESQYPGQSTLRCYESKGCTPEQLADMDQEQKRRVALLSCHLPYGAHEFFPQPSVYTTMLRRPLDRFLSAYFAFQQTPSLAAFPTFIDNAKRDGRDNRQVRLLATAPTGGDVNAEHLETAKRRLSRFPAIGLTERFHQSLALMRKVLRLRSNVYVTRNVTRSRPGLDDIGIELQRAILSVNEFDGELYAHAEHLFDEQCRQQGVGDGDIADVGQAGFVGTANLYARRALQRVKRL